MKRNKIRRFFQQKQYAIASFVLFAAIAGMTGIYVSNRITSERQQEELARKEAELAEKARREQEELAEIDNQGVNPFTDIDEPDSGEDAASVSSIVKPQQDTAAQEDENTVSDMDADTDMNAQNSGEQAGTETQQNTGETKQDGKPQEEKTEKPEKSKQETAAKAAALSFSPETDLGWPLQGDVILNYSMDQTIYFSTLEQYKYNPAVIIAGKVNDPVNAAATGKITDISTNEETGVTVTMELGDGYSAVYGQLKEVLYKEGATVEAGNAIGYIAEPTKYYSVEGSNLYFELQKDGEPVNPMQYME